MKNDNYLGVKMPDDLRKELQEMSEQEDRSEASIVRVALREWLKQRKEQATTRHESR